MRKRMQSCLHFRVILKDSPARIFLRASRIFFYTFAMRFYSFVNVKNNEYFRSASLIIITIRHVWYNFCTFVRTIKGSYCYHSERVYMLRCASIGLCVDEDNNFLCRQFCISRDPICK